MIDMWQEPTEGEAREHATNGTSSRWNEFTGVPAVSHAQASPVRHGVHPINGEAPSRLFVEPSSGKWTDVPLLQLGDHPYSGILLASGLILAASGATASSSFRMRLRGQLVVPGDLATRVGPVPICFVLMGNHPTFDALGAEIPSHEGYLYLQQALADLGVASCSVDTNLAYPLSANPDIRTRAEILVETIALVRASAPAALRPRLDFSRVGLIGHSRGGEAVVMATLLAAARRLPFTVRCVGSIAPTDLTRPLKGGRVDGAVPVPLRLGGAVRYLALLGSHDGDVSDMNSNGFGLYDRAACSKTLVYVKGLTHNRFNTRWDELPHYSDGDRIFWGPLSIPKEVFSAEVHRRYATFLMGALVRRTLLGDASAENALRGLESPSGSRLGQPAGQKAPAASIQWSVAEALTVDEFDGPTPRATVGGKVEAADTGRGKTIPHATGAFVASAAGDRVRVDLPAAARDLRARHELTFRLTSMVPVADEAAIKSAALPDWEMRVITSRGTSAAGPAQLDRRGLRDPNRPFLYELDGPLNVTKNQYDTLSIPLSAFSKADWADVRAVEFEARSGSFPLIVDSIAFV